MVENHKEPGSDPKSTENRGLEINLDMMKQGRSGGIEVMPLNWRENARSKWNKKDVRDQDLNRANFLSCLRRKRLRTDLISPNDDDDDDDDDDDGDDDNDDDVFYAVVSLVILIDKSILS